MQNPEQLEFFEGYLNPDQYYSFPRSQYSYVDYNGLRLYLALQAAMSSGSSSEDAIKAMIIRSLTETYKSDPEALGKAMAAFLANLK
ncbi:MAG: hypothetical protein K2X28_06045 [Alphaproteobacteria bacterium]|nr:hypothetical protein [Alphaproteobacteria bacterium]